jgi:FlaA1/EpsC-like NDP-sugar epimerase
MKHKWLENKTIAVTGSSGSWGNELIKQLLANEVKEIKAIARGEHNQVKLYRKFKDKRLKIILGDVRDYNKMNAVFKGVNIVFHLAAMKHIDLAEKFPYECIKTNINGTRNVIRAANNNKVEKFIDVSTDKSCAPINVYGMCKGIGEKLTLNGANLSKNTQYMVVRGGNVMGSNGSVIPFFIDQIKNLGKVTITDTRMTRFFLTIPEAIELLLTAGESDISGGLFVLNMPRCKIIDLAKVLIDHYAEENTVEIEEIGMRPGEKLHEVLVSKDEALHTYIYNDKYFLIYPQGKLLNYELVQFEEFNSNQNLMTKEEIKALLKKGGFLK